MKNGNGETFLPLNPYYEKNVTTEEVTCHYYLGDKTYAAEEILKALKGKISPA